MVGNVYGQEREKGGREKRGGEGRKWKGGFRPPNGLLK